MDSIKSEPLFVKQQHERNDRAASTQQTIYVCTTHMHIYVYEMKLIHIFSIETEILNINVKWKRERKPSTLLCSYITVTKR